jgi:heme exporter protein CcmD
MTELLGMGGYAPYVWSAYGITLAALVLNYWSARRLLRRNLDRNRQAVTEETAARKPKVRQL